MRKIFFALISVLMLSSALGVARECVYDTRGFTFHCSNNMPGIEIGPGLEGEITVVCCFTETKYLDSNETLDITVEIVDSWFHRVQNEDLSWEEINETYPASAFITGVNYPESSKGFESFPVTVYYKLPAESPLYEAGARISSRIDIMLDMGGGIIPNNAILPQINIPDDWEGVQDNYVPLIAGGASLVVTVVLIITLFRKKRKSKRMRRAREL